VTSQADKDLPDDAWQAIVERCGEVSRVEHASGGINSDLAASLSTDSGLVFVKGVRVDGRNASAHRAEARVNAYLPATLAPRMRWQVEVAGWLLLGFEHVSGRHADITPGSPDLPLIVATVGEVQETLTPCPPVDVGGFADQWGRLGAWRELLTKIPTDLDPWTRDLLVHGADTEPAAINVMRGDSLAHTDVQPLNILVDGDRARLIDWAWARRAAPWVDAAFLIIRLISAGHSPVDAEEWASRTPAWPVMPEDAGTLFAVEVLGVWEWLLHNRPMPHRAALTDAARMWARYRLDRNFPDRAAE
jgi:hypothetical protein